MVNLTRIYTRTGDAGQTRLGDNSVTSKNDLRLHAYADVDEANAHLGLAIAVGALEPDVVSVLTEAGITVLGRSFSVHEVNGLEVGIAGTKGFVGGFPGAELPDFGEPLLRQVYAETTDEVDALEAGLEAISGCHLRLVNREDATTRSFRELINHLHRLRLVTTKRATRAILCLHGIDSDVLRL